MSNVNNLEQHIANLQINHGDNTIKMVKSGKKVGPAVPPKPKKCQPQVSITCSFIIRNNMILIYDYLYAVLTWNNQW